MKLNLNPAQTKMHDRAVSLSRSHRQVESELVGVLGEIGRAGLWRVFERTSLFGYAVGELGLSEPVAYAFIAVARKAMLVPALGTAVAGRRLIVSCLTPENAEDVIAFASAHTSRETDAEVARRNPKGTEGHRSKPLGGGRVRIAVTVSTATHEALERVRSLEAQRGKSGGLERALEAAAEASLERRDPVRRAQRAQAQARASKAEPAAATPASPAPVAAAVPDAASTPEPAYKPGLCTYRHKQKNTRIPLTASQRHAVHARDNGRCAHVGLSGKRCGADRWVDVHHVRPVSQGGGNEPENLTTLCSVHHDLVHQTSFPIDGQVSWLRSTEVSYFAG